MTDDFKLPIPPDDKFTVTKCNPIEREQCKIYQNELRYLKDIQLEQIRNRDEDSRDIGFSGMERNTNQTIIDLCKKPSTIPKSCPKIAEHTWMHNMEQFTVVLEEITGTDYELEAEKIRHAFRDVPKVDELIIERLDAIQNSYRNLPDEEEIMRKLRLTGMSEEKIIEELSNIRERAVTNSVLTWHFRFGIRCPNCTKGEIDPETKRCQICQIPYQYSIKRTLEMLRQKEDSEGR